MQLQPHNFSFPRSHRLSGNNQFAAVYQAKMRKNAGPISILTKPNDLPHNRLGLSVSRKVGNAIKRSRIKRLLRESYRLTQHQQPTAYDIVIVVRPHAPFLSLTDYQTHLLAALKDADKNWQHRQRRKSPPDKKPNA
ncbi:ribonuclease P protein component [Planctomycetota bacterium]|nr:ribonuclease P protein component [Planctomycetota bacterium]